MMKKYLLRILTSTINFFSLIWKKAIEISKIRVIYFGGVMDNQYLLFLDNSFRESYCYEEETEKFKEKWDSVIESIIVHLPNFERDFKLIEVPFCVYESICLKSLSSSDKQLRESCFPPPSKLLISRKVFEENPEEAVKLLDDCFIQTFENLIEFYKQYLDLDEIIRKIDEKLKKPLHSNVASLREQLIDFKNNIQTGKDSSEFLFLCRDFAWDTMTKRQNWAYNKDKDCIEEFIELREDQIIKRLIMWNYNSDDYLPSAALLIRYARLLKISKNKPNISERELLDSYCIEYACLGFYDHISQQKKQAIMITCDTKQGSRVEAYISAKKSISKELERIGKKEECFMPGYIIIVDPVTNKVRGNIIDISKLVFSS